MIEKVIPRYDSYLRSKGYKSVPERIDGVYKYPIKPFKTI